MTAPRTTHESSVPIWLRWIRHPWLLRTVTQLAAYFGFYFMEHALEDFWPFAHMRQIGFVQTGAMVSGPIKPGAPISSQPRIILVDISDQRGPSPSNASPSPVGEHAFTDRDMLDRLLRRIASCGPAAIGFDIDLAGSAQEQNGAAPPHHFQFLQATLEFSPPPLHGLTRPDASHAPTTTPALPVFLGVHRTAFHLHQDDWLGGGEYAHLAASITVLSDAGLEPPLYSLIPFSIAPRPHHAAADPHGHPATASGLGENPSILPSLSAALAAAWHHEPIPPPAQPRWMSYLVAVHGPAHEAAEINAFYVNYRFLPLVAAANTPPIRSSHLLAGASVAASDRERLSGSIVLVGQADPATAVDKHIVPGQRELVPGIYLHACGILTLLSQRLWRLGLGPELALGLGVTFLAGALLGRLRLPHSLHDYTRHQIIHGVTTIALIYAVAWVMAAAFAILWIGWIASAVGAGVETAILLFVFPKSPAHHRHSA